MLLKANDGIRFTTSIISFKLVRDDMYTPVRSKTVLLILQFRVLISIRRSTGTVPILCPVSM